MGPTCFQKPNARKKGCVGASLGGVGCSVPCSCLDEARFCMNRIETMALVDKMAMGMDFILDLNLGRNVNDDDGDDIMLTIPFRRML